LLASTNVWPERMLLDVGEQLRRGRQASVQEGETYDEQLAIEYAPINVETCGFRILANPRRIGVREVAKHAKPNCRQCKGIGYWPVTRSARTGTDDSGNKVMQKLEFEATCKCADRRYREKFPRILIDSQNGEWIALEDLSVTHAEASDGNAAVAV
jgi:hypothetical protein